MSRRLALCLAFLLPGCAEEDDDLGELPRHPVPGCEAIDHAPCDVVDQACQERLLALAACLRGSEAGDPPAFSVISKEQYAAQLLERVAENPPPDPNPWERALVLLGLVQPGALAPSAVVAEAVDAFVGYYDRSSQEIVLIDQEAESSPEQASATLLHEFVHLLQDRDIDLQRFYDEYALSSDGRLVVRSLIEGEAELHDRRYWASLLGLDPARVDWKNHFQSKLERSEAEIVGDASPYLAGVNSFPYAWGGRYQRFAWEAGGLDGVLERFASPPGSTRELMASVDAIAPEPEAPQAWDPPVAPEDWTLFASDVFGAWNLFLALSRSMDVNAARERALALRGDSLWVFERGAGAELETAVLWRMEFADEASAADAAHFRPQPTRLSSFQEGVRVTWRGSDGPSAFTPP